MTEFHVVYRDLRPPSINDMYFNGPHGQRVLSKEGKAFKDGVKDAVAQATIALPWKTAVDEVYLRCGWVHVRILLVFERLYNGSWKPGRKTEAGNLSSPYKKVDASNYAKIIEDAIALGTGIDDSAHLGIDMAKDEDKSDPRIEIWYAVYPKERSGK